jgi:hypothetical protein
VQQAAADVDRDGARQTPPRLRFKRRVGAAQRQPDEEARLRPGLDQTAVFELTQCLHHGRYRQALLARQPTHRRQALAGAQDAGLDQAGQLTSQLFVAKFTLHDVPFCVGSLHQDFRRAE